MLGATIVSTPMIVMTTIGDWVTFILVGNQQLPLLTLLVKLSSFKFDDAPFCDYPLVSFVVQNVDVNTPLVLCS
jgi:hypothetical protein